ncbi:MFS transporter [Cedecea neteri]|uniref:MFS transporter n=1 Tax=Cedecea neteri TaxID=158822 RepID=UPI0006913D6E|nr:MFS transporter [Cedecea neteri]
MTALRNLFAGKQLATTVLLISSLLLTIGRGLTLPFMTIYLSREYHMALKDIGLAITVALVAGVLFSLWFGILADKFDKKKAMLLAIVIFFGGFAVIPLVHHAGLVVLFYSIINCSYTVFSVVVKAWFSETLDISLKPKIFSLNYTFVNVGWTVGPPIGTFVVMYSTNLPFWLSAMTALLPILMIARYVKSLPVSTSAADVEDKVLPSPRMMLRDKQLMWFTTSAFLGSMVYGAFAGCLSQYAIVIGDTGLAEKVVSVVLSVNAIVVVAFQYFLGKNIRPDNIKKMMFFGTLFFVCGLGGFMISGTNLWLWGLSSLVFTIGELIYAPGEYMLVDNIAPSGLKSSYFAAQQLGWLGGACNPLVTGLLLSWLPPYMLFVVLMGTILLAYYAIVIGMNTPPRQPITA